MKSFKQILVEAAEYDPHIALNARGKQNIIMFHAKNKDILNKKIDKHLEHTDYDYDLKKSTKFYKIKDKETHDALKNNDSTEDPYDIDRYDIDHHSKTISLKSTHRK